MTSRRVAVIGHGMAAGRLVEEIVARDRSGRCRISVFGDEPHGAYNRVLLSGVLAGTHGAADVQLHRPGWHAAHGVTVHRGLRVTALDRTAREVVTADGQRHGYDVAVLATGSAPLLPPLRGLVRPDGTLLPGAFAFRTLADCEGLLAAAGQGKRAVVVGGGLLGLEAARGLLARGLEVEVVHQAPRLMEAQLDHDGAAVLRRLMTELGVSSYLEARATAVLGDEQVTGLRLADSYTLDCDLLVVACGIRPNTHLASEAGLAVRRGVVVDDALRSPTDPDVLAIGECAEHRGQVYGLVAPAWEQASAAAGTIVDGAPARPYTGSRLVTRLKAMGVELAAMGETQHDPHDQGDGAAEVLSFVDPVRGTYKKLVIRDGRLAGALLLGDIATVADVTLAFDRQSRLPADRLHLLFAGLGRPGEPGELPDEAAVCHCNAVSAGAVRACAADGAATVADVAGATRATTGCGTCRTAVAALLAEARSAPHRTLEMSP